MKKIILAISLSLLSTTLMAEALKITLTSAKTEYVLHEAINLKYTLENTTDKTLIIPPIKDSFIVEDALGNKIRPEDHVLQTLLQEGPCTQRIILQPHDKLEGYMWDKPFRSPLKQGKQKIIFEMDGTKYKCDYFDQYTAENTSIWRGQLQTPPIEISVTPPQGANLAVLDKYTFRGIRDALAGRAVQYKIYAEYPASDYALWIFLSRYSNYRPQNKCLVVKDEFATVANTIESEMKSLADQKQGNTSDKCKDCKKEVAIMEEFARYHQTGDDAIHLHYRLGEKQLRLHEYAKVCESFTIIKSLSPKSACGELYKKSAKRFIKALSEQGK